MRSTKGQLKGALALSYRQPMMRALPAVGLLVTCLLTTSAGAQQPQAPAAPTAAAPNEPVATVWTGDLDGMVKRRMIRVLVPYSKTHYFIDRGVQRGVTHDALKQFEEEFNTRRKTGNLRVHVVFLPTSRDRLQAALLEGRGDIVAANVTQTPGREEAADFILPTYSDVKQLVVTGPGAPAVATVDDLAGQAVHVRQGSTYRESLDALSATLKQKGKAPVDVKFLPDNLEDEDILEMVNAGLIKISVVDDHIANFWKQIFTGIVVHDDVAVRTGGIVAMALRKGSPQLKAELDAFVKTHGKGTAFGNVTLRKYLQNVRYAKGATSDAEIRKFNQIVQFFQKYGDKYDVDWLLMAAQGYQESGLDQNVKSKVGAIGVMQVMPPTGKDMNVGDISQLEPNIHAGVKYVRFVIDQYFKDEQMDRLNKGLFAFASYNAGPGRVRQLRAEAQKTGLDPNVWFNNVERVAARRIGRETVQYVSNIYKYYVAYQLAYAETQARREEKSL
jgi:membrane-bound lytic murein transglycosylase MltF